MRGWGSGWCDMHSQAGHKGASGTSRTLEVPGTHAPLTRAPPQLPPTHQRCPAGFPSGTSYRWVSWNPGTHGYNTNTDPTFLNKVLVHSFAGVTGALTTLLAPLTPGASEEAVPGLLTVTFVATNADGSARVRLTREPAASCCAPLQLLATRNCNAHTPTLLPLPRHPEQARTVRNRRPLC